MTSSQLVASVESNKQVIVDGYTFEEFIKQIFEPKNKEKFRELAENLAYGGINRYGALYDNEIDTLLEEYSAEETWEELVSAQNRKSRILNEAIAQTRLSPLKQVKSLGIFPSNVSCIGELQLIFKITDQTPKCVKAQSTQKLVDRGWAVFSLSKLSINPISDPHYSCEVNSDCIGHYSSCRIPLCWNKDNLPEPIIPEPNMGMCFAPKKIPECICEKNRCQPVISERHVGNAHFQTCKSGMNCFADEICLDFNTMGIPDDAIKRFDADTKQCHLQCENDDQCPVGSCVGTKLVSSEVWDTVRGDRIPWDRHPFIVDAPAVKYCLVP